MSEQGSSSIKEIFQKSGAILEGHFLLASGLHSPIYWEKFRVLQYPAYTEQLCGMIAQHFGGQGIQVVAGPTTGGIILAFEVARKLGVRSIFAEKDDSGKRSFRRGFVLRPCERVLVVDDILTTGSSVREVLSAIAQKEAVLTGIGVLVDRSEQEMDFGVPLFSCYRSVTPTYSPDICPLCAKGIPLVRPGSSQPI